MAETETFVPMLSRLQPPVGAVKNKKRRGRGIGSGLGKTAGKGMKGQKARHGNNFGKIGFEGGQTPLYRRLPKRGFKNAFAIPTAVVNVGDLNALDGAIDMVSLRAAGLVKGAFERLKILGTGTLDKALVVTAHAFSASAASKIVAAGGTVVDLEKQVD